MTFLNPVVLIALVGAAIPLIIHLINMRKPRRIDFSSLAFLEELRQQTIRRLRIRQWLLLVLRTLAIASLVLAFARPTVNSPAIAGLSSDHRSVAIVLDNSLSMDLRDQGGSYLSQAGDFVSALAARMGPSDELAVIPMVDDGLPVTMGRAALAQARMAEINPSYGRGRLAASLRNASTLLTTASNPSREIYVVSDFQETNFVDSAAADLSGDEALVLVPIGARSVNNVAVTEVRVVSSIVEVSRPTTLAVEVQNFGDEPVNNWGLSVYLEDERVAQSTVTLDPGRLGTVSLTITPRNRGWLKGRVALEDDEFEYDDERFFTLHVPEERRILVVGGADRSTQFLDLALSTSLREGGTLFEVEHVEEDAVSGTFSGQYDTLILLGLRRIRPGLAASVTSFIDEGGGVLLFAGGDAGGSGYNQLLAQLGAGSFAGIVEAEQGGAVATVSRLDREHPLFGSVFEESDSDRAVERPSVSKLIRYVPGAGDEQSILTTSIGLPMLQEVRHASGRILIAPFLPEPQWTDLPIRGLFVPLVVRSMYYLTSADGQTREGLTIQPGAVLRIASTGQTSRLKIVDQSGQEWIPDQRASAQGAFFTLPATLRQPGTYDVMGDEGLLQRFAVNLDQLESNLDRLDVEEASARIRQLTGVAPSILEPAGSGANLSEAIQLRESGVEIWNVFLSIALLLLVAEMLLSARWKPATSTQVSS